MNEMKPEDVMRAVAELRKRGLSNGGGLGYHAGWCDEVADLLENALALLREKGAEIERLKEERDLANAEREANVKGFTTEVEKMTIEIEALKIANEKMYAANKAQETENESLHHNLDVAIEMANLIRAEAINEVLAEIEEIRREYLEGKFNGVDIVVKLFLLQKKYTEGEGKR